MKKKRLAAVAVALALVLSLSVSALALNGIGIGDFLQIVSSIDTSKYTEYNEQQWTTMTPAERAEQFNFVIPDQKGTSRITENSNFINDSALSYKYYCGLVNNSLINQGLNNNLYSKTYLEFNGLADFGMGYYGLNGNGHSSGKFGDGTVADTLNDDFLDYMQKNPYSGNGSSNRYQFSNGYYVDYEPLLIGDWSDKLVRIEIDGVVHHPLNYGLQFYLHDETGKIIDMTRITSIYSSPIVLIYCDVCQGELFRNFTVTADGKFYFDMPRWFYNYSEYRHIFQYNNTSDRSSELPFPWWDLYGAVDEEEPPLFPAVGVDDDGNQIKLNVTSDGITYEGNTYQIDNSDHSVTIDGNKYYITVNPSDVDENYYNDFLQQVINNYYNYYNTDSKPFDGTDILTAIKSVFTSLETFRSYCYTQLKQLSDYVIGGFNSLGRSVSSVCKKLDDIISLLKEINKNVETITEEQEEKNKSDWADLISDFKDKVGWVSLDKSMHNIQTAFFGQRAYSVNSATGEIQVQIMQKNDVPIDSSMPELSIIYMGQSYNLYSLVPYFGGDIEPIKQFISLFLWVGFILSVFRSIPSILGGVGALQKDSHFLSKDGD